MFILNDWISFDKAYFSHSGWTMEGFGYSIYFQIVLIPFAFLAVITVGYILSTALSVI